MDRRGGVPDPGVRLDPAESGVPDGGRGTGADRRAEEAAGAAELPDAARCSCWWTASTWRRSRPCGTRGACGRPRCARCTSSSTPPRRKRCARSGPAPTGASCSTSSTARTGGWPGPRPNWSAPRPRCPARMSPRYCPGAATHRCSGRLLHDRTADKIAAVVSRIPHCAATIVPFDVRNRLEVLRTRQRQRDERQDHGSRRRDGKAAPDGQAAVTGTAATPGDGQAAPADYTPGAVATGAGEAGREDGRPAAPAPPPSAMRGLLPGRRFRQRRGGNPHRTLPRRARPATNGPRPPPGSSRSARSRHPGAPPSRGGSGPWRSGPWKRTRCWPARSRTRPGT